MSLSDLIGVVGVGTLPMACASLQRNGSHRGGKATPRGI